MYLCPWLYKEKHGGSDTKCPLTVKILDAVKGTPAGSVALRVFQKAADGAWTQIANGVTDDTGESHNLITEQQFSAGVYRVEFDTKSYWKNEGSTPFHEAADVYKVKKPKVHPKGTYHPQQKTLFTNCSKQLCCSSAFTSVTDVRHFVTHVIMLI
uniref:Transthyretin n=1 Tax=Sander lucioperca TaxID=283035 RepID=A0A8D0A1X6_SANLU